MRGALGQCTPMQKAILSMMHGMGPSRYASRRLDKAMGALGGRGAALRQDKALWVDMPFLRCMEEHSYIVWIVEIVV